MVLGGWFSALVLIWAFLVEFCFDVCGIVQHSFDWLIYFLVVFTGCVIWFCWVLDFLYFGFLVSGFEFLVCGFGVLCFGRSV